MRDAKELIVSNPEIMGGTPVFAGTRVPFQTFIDYLATDHTIEVFLDHFPTVSREQAIQALDLAKDLLLAKVG